MKVGLLTSWNERCGLAEYAANLIKHCPNVDFDIINSYQPQEIFERSKSCDIFIINYEPGLFPFIYPSADYMKSLGPKSILILHTSHEGNNRGTFTDLFGKVVIHEKSQNITNESLRANFVYIPMGLVNKEFDDKYNFDKIRIGTAGFPFNWKGFHPVAQAAERLGFHVRCIMPISNHVNVEPMKKVILESNPHAEIITDWLPQEQVIDLLHECYINVFAYEGSNSGISGAVRLGISAKRPLVISKCRQFRDLMEDYPDEVTIIDDYSVDGIIAALGNAAGSNKIPNRIIEDMKWDKIGKLYEELFERMMYE